MRKYIKYETMDLIYLDPPFNSNRTYNVLFKQRSGIAANAQITAFDDTSTWSQDGEQVYAGLLANSPDEGTRSSGKQYRDYADEGRLRDDVWTDINSLDQADQERLGYPMQKLRALLTMSHSLNQTHVHPSGERV